ncbi:MAG: hypothetical protein P4L41_18360 [Flavipsychrobacter sp.]|nr:hypothetical protein [Flavipsychrobacter sp.]
MKNLALVALSCFLLFAGSCKKDNNSSPPSNPTTNNPTANPYYFKFKLDTTSYNLNADIPQYMPFYANEIGGYQVGSLNLYPSAGIRLSWPYYDTVREADVMALKGKTLYFTDTLVHPEVSFGKDPATGDWFSVDTSNTTYNVKITNVVFLKKDTTLGYPLKTYVLTGTCSAVMQSPTNTISVFSGGDFNFIISRRDL